MSEQPVEKLGMYPGAEQGPLCCSGPADLWVCKPGIAVWSGGLEAGQRLPRPGQSPKHDMPTSLPKLA